MYLNSDHVINYLKNKYAILSTFSDGSDNLKYVEELFEDILVNSGLTDRQSEALRLHYEIGYSQTEIANRLGISIPSVNNRISAAIKRIDKELSRREISIDDVYQRHFTGS